MVPIGVLFWESIKNNGVVKMQGKFVEVEIAVELPVRNLVEYVEERIMAMTGATSVLRFAITRIDGNNMRVEAVILQ